MKKRALLFLLFLSVFSQTSFAASEKEIEKHIAAFKNKNWRVRYKAVEAIVSMDKQKVLPILITYITNADYLVRATVAIALGNMKAKRAVPYLLTIIKDKRFGVRFSVIHALGKIGGPVAIEALIKIVKGRSFNDRRAAIAALARTKNSRVLSVLIAMLKDKELAYYAAKLLFYFKSPKISPALLQTFTTDNWGAKRGAAIVLGRLKEKKAIPYLIKALRENSYSFRKQIAIALSRIGAAAVPYLAKEYTHSKKQMRLVIVKTVGLLWRRGVRQALPILRRALKDRDSIIRVEAKMQIRAMCIYSIY